MTQPRRAPTESELKFHSQLQAARAHIATAAELHKRRKMMNATEKFGTLLRIERQTATAPPVVDVVECFSTPAAVTAERIIKAVCRECGVSKLEITGPRRNAKIVKVRQAAMWLCKELTRSSFPAIGRKFGGRDHTTALHAVRVAARKLAEDEDLRLPIMRVWAEMAADLGEDAPPVPEIQVVEQLMQRGAPLFDWKPPSASLPDGVPEDIARHFERLTLDLIDRGFRRHSADAILHRIRWFHQVERRDDGVKVNNNHAAPLARWFMQKHPQHAEFFELRKSVAKAAPTRAYAD